MNFTKFDASILIVMSLSIIVMSLTFPALGMTDESDEVNATDFPELNLTSSTFDFAGDFPVQPTTPESGVLRYDAQDGNSITGINQIWIERPKDTGQLIELRNTSQDGFDVVVTNFSGTGTIAAQDKYDINSEGQEIVHNNESWVITFQVRSLENLDESNMTAEVYWQIETQPDDASGLSSIPLIGDITDQVANVLGFLAAVISWFTITTVQVIINAVVVLYEIVAYTFGIAFFLIDSYNSIVSAAPSYAAVVLVTVEVILFAEFAKVGYMAISLLPTT